MYDSRLGALFRYIDLHVDKFVWAKMAVVYAAGAHKLAFSFIMQISKRELEETVGFVTS